MTEAQVFDKYTGVQPGSVQAAPVMLLLDKYLVGRRNPFVYQKSDGSYAVVRRHLSAADLAYHLDGGWCLGTYTINEEGKVRAVTWDIDNEDMSLVYRLLGSLTGHYMVFTSGRKGYHVVQAFDPPIPSAVAHDYGVRVKQEAGVDCESFPKQREIKGTGGAYGNLTKLPLGVHQVTKVRTQLVMGTWGYTDPGVLQVVQQGELTPHGIVVTRKENSKAAANTTTWLSRLWDGDTSQSGGRNNSLRQLAWWLGERGFPAELIRTNVEWVNSSCFTEPLEQDELDKTVLREV